MLTDFQNSFGARILQYILSKQSLNIPQHFKHVATLPCEMFVLKNRPCTRA